MIEISTKFNASDRRDLKKQQNLILIAGAVGASFGVVGGIVLAVFVKPIFLILLIGSAVIFFTALFFCRYLASAAEKNSQAHFVLSFDETSVKIQKIDPSLLTPIAPTTHPLDACSVAVLPNGNYRLTAPNPTPPNGNHKPTAPNPTPPNGNHKPTAPNPTSPNGNHKPTDPNSTSPNENYRPPASDIKSYVFNRDGFTVGSPADLEKLLKKE